MNDLTMIRQSTDKPHLGILGECLGLPMVKLLSLHGRLSGISLPQIIVVYTPSCFQYSSRYSDTLDSNQLH